MTQIFGSCSRYVQGFGELENLEKHIGWMGSKFLILASRNRIHEHKEKLERILGSRFTLTFEQFSGESDRKEVERLLKLGEGKHYDGIIGMGGGKIADTVKCVAQYLDLKLIIIPTTAASDAYTSATGLLYDETGTISEIIKCNKNPDLVLVDTKIIMNSPLRLFISGIGDTLSTYIGAKVCYEGFKNTHFDALGTDLALAIAKCSYDTILKYGRQAIIAAKEKVMTQAYNKVIEANVLMSGLGFENNGSASDHIFFFGAESLSNREHYCYHGEGVAFSCCCQLVIQGTPDKELDEFFMLLRDIGLPITFADMHLDGLTEQEFEKMAEYVCSHPFSRNHPFEFTKEKVIGAYKTADEIGRLYKNGGRLI